MLDRIVGTLALIPFAIGSLSAPAGPSSPVDFTFQDPEIVESSGLVVQGDLFVTTNDSGDSGRVFVVDTTGKTVGETTWAADPWDIEALAPAGPGEVWVGDIGDNTESRESIEVLRVPFGRSFQRVEPASYALVYPDGPHNAESLMANPQTGQLFVVTKDIFGGVVYAAPTELSSSRPNKLRAVSDSRGFATDAAFFPDGKHYVVRDYLSASIYTFPGHEKVGSFTLPKQQQGEGVTVDENDDLHISTEGQFTAVRRVRVPTAIWAPPTPAATPAPEERVVTGSSELSSSDELPWPWLIAGGMVAAVLITGGIVIRRRS